MAGREHDIAHAQYIARLPDHAATTQQRTTAARELHERKRLGQIVVGTGVERANLIRVLAARRDHDNRHARPSAYRLNHLDAIHVGQAQVEQHDARRLRRRSGNGGVSGLHGHMTQAVRLECGYD